MNISIHLREFKRYFPGVDNTPPWTVVADLHNIIRSRLSSLGNEYTIIGETAVHKSATVEQHVIMKGPVIIGANCFIGAHAYLRGGVFLGERVTIGPGCEVKTSIILDHSALAHFNFAGDSIIGSQVNLEAGAVLANHHNDRDDKTIHLTIDGTRFTLDVDKFGSLVGDSVKIGANAVCGPGTFLAQGTIVKRLSLIEQ